MITPAAGVAAPAPDPLILYNLFPRLAGRFAAWGDHLARAAELGCTWIYLNPIHPTGASGNLYAVSDPFTVAPEFLTPGDPRSALAQLEAVIALAHAYGLKVMGDLVINHMAVDAPLVAAHPAWFRFDAAGAPVAPGAYAGERKVRVWGGLIEVANAESPDRERLWAHWQDVVTWFVTAGFDGFRADCAHQIPKALWRRLIAHAERLRPGFVTVADTLGCPDWQVVETVQAGFTCCLNSSRWWDFQQSWCLDQYRATSPFGGSISFPESHDTARLMSDLKGDVAAVRGRYLFAALFSRGVQFPMGFEHGARKRLSVVHTTPLDREEPFADLTGFIREVHGVKRRYPVFQADHPIERLSQPDPAVLVLRKTDAAHDARGLVVLNTQADRPARVFIPDLAQVLGTPTPRDVTPVTPVTPATPSGTAEAAAGALRGRLFTAELPPWGFRVLVAP